MVCNCLKKRRLFESRGLLFITDSPAVRHITRPRVE